MKKVISAHTSYPNSPDTDQLPIIPHDVMIENNKENFIIEIMAIDPLDALDKAHKMDLETCKKFKKKF